ncbi:DUF4176 domain-containing protein [Pseudolactococcus reticulitermitis]|uniref:DUF4176 domain-containing protein n=1 Tax=Pseudolactococcus reticulitermitis TaxID=2025039 RepID=A0A224XB43_9LACT|nr:DUF4176 domain-containing protein [Lactococcus reticulitermitis]GAX48470.1 hypothetical protein RsY01_2099 [Lactococcus reticulitermitis]
MKNNKNWLSIGTTVLLEGATQPLMIVGRYQLDDENNVYDYVGVLNPQGFEDAKSMYLFNERAISEIIFKASATDYEEAYLDKLNDFIEGEK